MIGYRMMYAILSICYHVHYVILSYNRVMLSIYCYMLSMIRYTIVFVSCSCMIHLLYVIVVHRLDGVWARDLGLGLGSGSRVRDPEFPDSRGPGIPEFSVPACTFFSLFFRLFFRFFLGLVYVCYRHIIMFYDLALFTLLRALFLHIICYIRGVTPWGVASAPPRGHRNSDPAPN